jgi:hypothetical protein
MPIRKIPKNYRNVTGIKAAAKGVGPSGFESTLERDFLALLEFSPEVAHFEVQPLRIEWRDEDGNPRSYTPDVLVEFKPEVGRRPWLCEVKYRSDLQKYWADLKPKLRRGLRFAKQKHWRFRIVTEVEIRTSYLTNVRFLSTFRFRDIPEASSQKLLQQLAVLQEATPNGLMTVVTDGGGSPVEWLPVLWHLIAHHRIGADLEGDLTMDMPIWSVS